MDALPDKDIKCHHTGFEKSCRDMVVNCNCRKWVNILGADPQTGATFNNWNCLDSFMPKLILENTQQQRQTGAAVESFRNEVVRRHDENLTPHAALPAHAFNVPLLTRS